ncbi:hypothetical protein SAMN05421780_104117 [Flexibacter flexilis DSM 6793]|uniref:SpoIIAA-like n=1 Tax=Flexibacter flexilis DSM 6793 TaxID=927664 RepID=A0A1I1HVP3_9BACT|nr:hypothetical protein [Flexibacter flexilis]SFC28219.1 hypothetical protein SAMN05421780_104117 [Flexibacter flexilis DSM 6793]
MNPTFEVRYDEQTRTVCADTFGFLGHDLYQEGWLKVLKLLEVHHCQKIFMNVSDGKIISAENQQWFLEKFIPKMERLMSGRNLYQARVVNDSDYFSKISTQNVYKKVQQQHSNAHLMDFKTQEEALAWLSKY